VPEAQDDSWAINSEVERLARAANDKRSLAWALNGLGMCCYWQEDYAKARSFLQECEIYFVDLGEFNGMGHTAWAISNVERRQGRYAEAYTLNADSMKMGIDVKNYMGLPYHLESFAYLAIEVQKPQRAVQLLAAAQKTRELYRSSQQPMVTREYESYLAILRPMLSEHEFQTAWAQGYAMTTQAAIEYSLQDDYSAPLATIAQTPAATELMRARALCGAGRLTFYTGDLQGARQHLEESLQLARRSGDELQIARALNATGLVLVVSGEFQRASVLFDEALAIARRTGDQEIFLDTLVNLGYIIADLEARSDTCALFEEGVRTARKAGDKRSLGMLLTNLGMLMCFDGQWEDSLPLMQEGLIVTREIGETWNEARTHWCLGHHTLWNAPTTVEATERRAIAEKAMLHFSETLRIIRGINGQWETPYIIEGFALMAIGRGEFEHGAWLFGVSESLRERLKSVVAPAVRPHYERFVSLARMEIGDETYAAAHAKGSLHGLHMPTEEALSILPPTEKLKQDLPL
jgi:tetratricopeptide (TPR) repeat protein